MSGFDRPACRSAKGCEEQTPPSHQEDGNGRPPVRRALDEPEEECEHGATEQGGADGVDRLGGDRLVAGKNPDGGDQPGEPENDVDQEHRAPVESGDVGRDDESCGDWAEDGR